MSPRLAFQERLKFVTTVIFAAPQASMQFLPVPLITALRLRREAVNIVEAFGEMIQGVSFS